MAKTYIGTSGWMYKHWRAVFYPPDLPPARWFAYYTRHFETVEINTTFYRLPDASTFAAWRDQAPPGFTYSVKASRYITHLKKLQNADDAVERLLERARVLGPSLGPILFQLPPNWNLDLERLAAFLELLPPNLHHVFEFRHPSWFAEEALTLLDRHGAGFCVMDLPGLETPIRATGRLGYIRLHGPARAYEGSYSDTELRAWATRIREIAGNSRPTYVYFNNDSHGYAALNALRLRQLLGQNRAGLHELRESAMREA